MRAQFAFPTFDFFPRSNNLIEYSGSLFDLPRQARSDACKTFYREVRSNGWSVCPVGYAIYSRYVDDSHFLIAPGLRIQGLSRISGKTEGLTIRTSRQRIERYFDTALDARTQAIENARALLRKTIHELRGLNSININAVQELEHRIGLSLGNYVAALLGNIYATSSILSTHLDVVSFIENPDFLWPIESIPVYRKFDKLVRCFKPQSGRKNIDLDLQGQSHSHVHGPGIFEIIPFLALDNAIKYSPAGERVEVRVTENHMRILAEVRSLGPKLEMDEERQVFERGFRGSNAKQMTRVGDGEGLALLRDLVERLFRGRVFFAQERAHLTRGNVPFARTKLMMELPLDSRSW